MGGLRRKWGFCAVMSSLTPRRGYCGFCGRLPNQRFRQARRASDRPRPAKLSTLARPAYRHKAHPALRPTRQGSHLARGGGFQGQRKALPGRRCLTRWPWPPLALLHRGDAPIARLTRGIRIYSRASCTKSTRLTTGIATTLRNASGTRPISPLSFHLPISGDSLGCASQQGQSGIPCQLGATCVRHQ